MEGEDGAEGDGGADGWRIKEVQGLPICFHNATAEVLSAVESGADWPELAVRADMKHTKRAGLAFCFSSGAGDRSGESGEIMIYWTNGRSTKFNGHLHFL